MDMQREDFLALTRGAMGYNELHEPGYFGSQTYIDVPISKYHRWVPVCCGSARYDQIRIMNDWFPQGTIFEFLGTTCFSRGTVNEKETPLLKVLAPAKEGGMEEVTFAVREVLSIAKQISVDTINRLNGVNHRGL